MTTTKTHTGVPWDGRTAYERWVEDDLGLDLHRGYSASALKKVPVKPWPERNILATFYDIIGAESLAGMYVGEIAPGQSSKPARQLCDEVIYVMAGRGSTTVDTRKGPISLPVGLIVPCVISRGVPTVLTPPPRSMPTGRMLPCVEVWVPMRLTCS